MSAIHQIASLVPLNFSWFLQISVVFSIWLGLSLSGRACIQHFALRFVLYRSGLSPWNYARFLNYATDRMFLQRIGGRYRFIHKLLQEHFAKMEL